MQETRIRHVFDLADNLKCWIELQKRLGPELAPVELALHCLFDGRVSDIQKTANVR